MLPLNATDAPACLPKFITNAVLNSISEGALCEDIPFSPWAIWRFQASLQDVAGSLSKTALCHRQVLLYAVELTTHVPHILLKQSALVSAGSNRAQAVKLSGSQAMVWQQLSFRHRGKAA